MATANPIVVGDRVHYLSRRGGAEHVIGGIVAERAPSPLGTGDRIRVVDSAGEMADPDAGRWIAATDPIWAGPAEEATMAEACTGHLAFHGGYEYFMASGDVYRAPEGNPIDVQTGFRTGARFESTQAAWPLRKRILGLD